MGKFKGLSLFLFSLFLSYFYVKYNYINSGGFYISDNLLLFIKTISEILFYTVLLLFVVFFIVGLLKNIIYSFVERTFFNNLVLDLISFTGIIIGTIFINNTLLNDNSIAVKKIGINKNIIEKKYDITADKMNINTNIIEPKLLSFNNSKILGGFNINSEYLKINNINNIYSIFIKKLNINNKIVLNTNLDINNILKNKLKFNINDFQILLNDENNIKPDIISMIYIYTKYVPLNLTGTAELKYLSDINKILLKNFNLKNRLFDLKNANILLVNKNNINFINGTIIIHMSLNNINELYNLYTTFYQNFKEKVNYQVLKITEKEKLSLQEFINYLYSYFIELNKNKSITIKNINEIKNNFNLLLNNKNIKFDINIKINN